MNTDEIDTRLLSDLRALREVADDLHLDPPPLPDVRRRAGRRHRARLARRATGVTALVAAGVLAATLLPAARAPDGGTERLEPVQLAGTVMPKPKRDDVCDQTLASIRELPADVLRLPASDPAGLRLGSVRRWREDLGCHYPALSAWHVAEGSSRLDRRVQVNVQPPPTKALPGTGRCGGIALEGQPGRCVTLVVGGRERPVWWWDSKRAEWGDAHVLSWVDGGYVWILSEYGLDEATLTDFVAGIRTYADGTLTGSLPGGFQAWQPPAEVTPSLGLTATYLPVGYQPNGPLPPRRVVGFWTSNSPSADPFADFLMAATDNSPAGQPRIVDVGGHRGLWSVDPIAHQGHLAWPVGNGVTLTVVVDDLDGVSLDEVLAVARSVRRVPRDDPRLADPPPIVLGATPGTAGPTP